MSMIAKKLTAELLSMPLPQRRYISIVDGRPERDASWDYLEDGISRLGWFGYLLSKPPLSPLSFLSGPALLLTLAPLLRRLWTELQSAKIQPLPVPITTASGLSFPVHGKPVVGQVYIAHPLIRGQYIPAASFAPYIIAEQQRELERLLRDLGATRVRTYITESQSRSGEARMKGKAPGTSGDVGLSGGASAGSGITREHNSTFPGHSNPSVPADLVWYNQTHETQEWAAIAGARLERGATTYSTSWEASEDFGANAELGAFLEGAKIDIGGKYQSLLARKWQVDVEFGRTDG